jgi:hypothetical protein
LELTNPPTEVGGKLKGDQSKNSMAMNWNVALAHSILELISNSHRALAQK